MLDEIKQGTDAKSERRDAIARMLLVLSAMVEKNKQSTLASYQRLVDAAARMRGIYGGTALTKALHYSDPQLVNNWQRRGVSRDGALDAERHLGIPAIYILDGTTPPCDEWLRLKDIPQSVEQLTPVYETNELRELNQLARSMDKASLRALLMLMKKL